MINLHFQAGWYIACSAIMLLLVFLLLLIKKQRFISTDQKPELLQFFPFQGLRSTGVGEIAVGLHIKSFPTFELVEDTFTMDALIWFEFNPSLVNLETIKSFSFDRSKMLYKSEPKIIFKNNLLLVIYHIQVRFNTNLDYTYFPVNDHKLYLVLDNENISPQELVYTIRESSFTLSSKIHTHDWFIANKAVETGYNDLILESHNSTKKMSHPRVIFSLDLARAGLRKAVLIFFPVLIFLLVAAYTLIMNPLKIGAAIYIISITSISGLLFYRFIIESISPKVGYVTLSDYFFIINVGLAFIIFIIDIFSLEIGHRGTSYSSFFYSLSTISFEVIQVIIVGSLYYLLYHWKKEKKLGRTKPTVTRRIFKISLDKFTITNLMRYSSKIDECPAIDNENYWNPDYATFYKKYTKGLLAHKFNKLTYLIGFRKKPTWTPELFSNLLIDLVDNPISNYQGDFIVKLKTSSHSRIVIWGDLQGAFHSLVRDLNKLKDMKVLNNFLKINSENDYFIFNGDAIDRSPYILETLTVIMQLIRLNPHQVFYVKGDHENHELWTSFQTAVELKMKTKYIFKDNGALLIEYLKKFFNTLPLAIYIQSEDNLLMRVSHYNATELPYAESDFYNFLSTKTQKKISFAKLENHFFSQQEISLKACINSINHIISIETFKGLELLAPQNAVMTWSILSSPTLTYGTLYKFFYDAFVILESANNIDLWTLTLYYQDVRKLSGYVTEHYSLIYGIKISDLKSFKQLDYHNKIVVGCTLDLSKSSSALGEQIREGLNLGIIEQNSGGGIKNRPVHFITLDDEYTPHLARKNIFNFLNVYHTDLILSPLGTPTTEAFLPLIQEKKILVLFPYTGASIFRNPALPYIAHFTTSYANEAQALISYLVESLYIKRIVLFYQNDSYGLSALEGARKKLKQLEIDEWLETPYQRNNPNIDEAARKIIEFNPAAILFFSTNSPSISLIPSIRCGQLCG